jgi:hypothetical protein
LLPVLQSEDLVHKEPKARKKLAYACSWFTCY